MVKGYNVLLGMLRCQNYIPLWFLLHMLIFIRPRSNYRLPLSVTHCIEPENSDFVYFLFWVMLERSK